MAGCALRMARTIYRSDDGSEWENLEQAENHEKRMRLIREKLNELGGPPSALSQLITKDPDRQRGFAFSYAGSDYEPDYFVRQVACEMDELVALAAVLKPILDECGANPYPLNY